MQTHYTTTCPYVTVFTLAEFLAQQFPPPDKSLDRYSGTGTGDLMFKPPKPGGHLTVVLPRETAGCWQRQPAINSLPPATRFVVAPADSLTVSDMNDALAGMTARDGFLIDIATFASWHRALVREIGRPYLAGVEEFRAEKGARGHAH